MCKFISLSRFLFAGIITLVLATACSRGSLPAPATIIATPLTTPSASLEPTLTSTVQLTATVTPSPTQTSTINDAALPPEDILQYHLLEVAPTLPIGANLSGTLIVMGLGNDPSYYLNFTNDIKKEILKDRYCYSTSPDGKWAAYCQDLKDPHKADWLIIESADGLETKKLAIENDWSFGDPIWLDNQHLVFNLWKDKSQPPSSILPILVINPFTGERQELPSDYPDLRPSGMGPNGSNMDFIVSTVVYHPSLNLVIYPKTTQNGFSVVLWDRQTQHARASIESLGGFFLTPIWSPDGKQFVVALVPHGGKHADDFSEFIEEWFSVSREGQVQQLTNLKDYFLHADIGSASWSPDGSRLAFWLSTKPSLCGNGLYLSLLEMESLQVTNYCILGSYGLDAFPPIWSPDSRFIAVEGFQPDHRPVFLINIEQGWVAQIGVDRIPVGWLIAP